MDASVIKEVSRSPARRFHSYRALVALGLALLASLPSTTRPASADDLTNTIAQLSVAPGSQFSVFAGSKLTRPAPVRATDGRIHLVYELVLTSTARIPVAVDQVEVRDAHSQRVLLSLSGEALAANMNPLAGLPAGAPPSAATTVGASGASIVWFDVTVRRAADVPQVLEHLCQRHHDATEPWSADVVLRQGGELRGAKRVADRAGATRRPGHLGGRRRLLRQSHPSSPQSAGH